MRIAFVGVKRKYQELAPEYRNFFNQYHLELPYYYAKHGDHTVTITTVDWTKSDTLLEGDGFNDPWLHCEKEEEFIRNKDPDLEPQVVIHWRKWFPELYRPGAINLLNCQDHSFSPEWKDSVRQAMNSGKLYGILCFPTWHKQNIHDETGIPLERLFDGVTLGVDPDVYKPALVKDPFQMLWASDPGRGIVPAVLLAAELFQRDKRFRLHVCVPDYVKGMFPYSHPSIVYHGNVSNGPKLWELFNSSGILPYTSCFKEPSSRAHRQAQAAGCLVLYPPGMGTPSELIQHERTGIVEPIAKWADRIRDFAVHKKYTEIGRQAREFAISESWAVQAQNFNRLIEKIKGEQK